MSPSTETTSDKARRLSQDPKRCYRKRIAAGLTQKQLADRAGLTDATVCRVENGDVSAHPDTLHALATAFGCDIADLMPEVA